MWPGPASTQPIIYPDSEDSTHTPLLHIHRVFSQVYRKVKTLRRRQASHVSVPQIRAALMLTN